MLLRALLIIAAVCAVPQVWAGEYKLTIERRDVTITGRPVSSITVNGQIPGPTLRFREGEDVTIHVTNRMREDASVHWHGLLLPGEMDGVPGFNGFPGIKPGATFTYRFHIRQAGTYWYHSHTNTQEQAGLYGALVIEPRVADPVQTDRDHVVVLSDFTEEDTGEILRNLKNDHSYYNRGRRTVGDFFQDADATGLALRYATGSTGVRCGWIRPICRTCRAIRSSSTGRRRTTIGLPRSSLASGCGCASSTRRR